MAGELGSDDLAGDVLRTWETHDGDRGTFKNHWQEVANYMHTDRADYQLERTPGSKRQQYVFDATAPWALQQFAAGLHSFLTSPFLPWFALHADNDALNGTFAVRAWFDAAADVMANLFNGPRHNFASQSQEVYMDLGSIGSAVMSVLESQRSEVLFSTRHLKECCFWENEEDRVDGLVRRFKMTAKQAVEQWQGRGIELGDKIKKAYEDKPSDTFVFYHRVQPRKKRDAQRADRTNKPFESVYVSEIDKRTIDIGGFDEFPYLCPRLDKVTGEIYGRGLGMLMLPDVKMLNEMVKTLLKASQKIVDPPLQLPDDGFVSSIKTTPGSLNFYRSGARPTDRIAPIETHGNIPIGIELVTKYQSAITRGFYVDYMMMPQDSRNPGSSGKGITAEYIINQRDQQMRLLSPMLARLQSEFLDPLINRVFAILWRKSKALRFGPGSPFPMPPPELSGAKWHVEYVSPIAIAQKSSQLDGVQRLIQAQMALRQADPDMPIVIDGEAIMRLTGRDLNAPVIALRSPERMQAEAAQRAEQQQKAEQAAMLEHAAGALGKGGAGIKSLAEAGAAAQGGGADAGGGDQMAEAA